MNCFVVVFCYENRHKKKIYENCEKLKELKDPGNRIVSTIVKE